VFPALILTLLLIQPAAAFDWKGGIATRALKTSLTARCGGFIRANPDQKLRLASICATLSEVLVDSLDSIRNEQTRGLLFFTQDTKRVLTDPRTGPFLSKLRMELEDLKAFRDPALRFPLYRRCLETYGSPESAALVMITLFQDNSFHPDRPGPPPHWVMMNEKQKEWGVPSSSIEDLREILKMIRTQDARSLLPQTDAFPQSAENLLQNFNDKFYYYYLPRLLTRKLLPSVKSLNRDHPGNALLTQKVIRALPTLMALIYKQARGNNSYVKTILLPLKPTARQNQDGTLVVEPGWEYRYRDLYMAYLGTLDALGRRDPYGFERFRKTLALNPGELIGLISK
jgi:hypothetical protein